MLFKSVTHLIKVLEDYIVLTSLVLSILEAVLTASPNRQYLGIFKPTTPATTAPVCTPEKARIVGKTVCSCRKCCIELYNAVKNVIFTSMNQNGKNIPVL